MPELYRVIPEESTRPAATVWTTRESLDRAMQTWKRLMNDERQPEALRMVALRLTRGRIQVASEVLWTDETDLIDICAQCGMPRQNWMHQKPGDIRGLGEHPFNG